MGLNVIVDGIEFINGIKSFAYPLRSDYPTDAGFEQNVENTEEDWSDLGEGQAVKKIKCVSQGGSFEGKYSTPIFQYKGPAAKIVKNIYDDDKENDTDQNDNEVGLVKRAALSVTFENIFELFPKGPGRDCEHEKNTYLEHDVRREEWKYDCNDWELYEGSSQKLREIKKREDLGKRFTVWYHFYDQHEKEIEDTSTSVIYDCQRYHLNAFVLDSEVDNDLLYSIDGGAAFKRYPFICIPTDCPIWPEIQCTESCEEEQLCVGSLYQGQAIGDYLFEIDEEGLNEALQWVKDLTNKAIIKNNYAFVRYYDENDKAVCWLQFEVSNKREYGGIEKASGNDKYAAGHGNLQIGTIIHGEHECDVNLSEDEPKRKHCEYYDEKRCKRCYAGYTLFDLGATCLNRDDRIRSCKTADCTYCRMDKHEKEVCIDLKPDNEKDKVENCNVQLENGKCYICNEGHIVSADETECVLNTLCVFEDEKKQEHCEHLNDEITSYHMKGCRILISDHTQRGEDDYEGDWRCGECKTGFYQKSVNNEFCAPTVSGNVESDNSDDQKNRDRLKNC